MNEIWMEIQEYILALPDILFAIIVFLVGWLISFIISKAVKGILSSSKWDNKLFDSFGISPNIKPEIVISKIAFYILLVVSLVVALDVLNLHILAQPIMSVIQDLIGAIPDIMKAALILLAGWIVASIVRVLVIRGGNLLRIDSLLQKWKIVTTDEQAKEALRTASRIAFYFILLLFIPGVLSALHISAISDPFSIMLSEFLLFVPRLFAAGLILLIGWIVAKIAREIVTNLLKSVGLEKLAERMKLSKVLEKTSLSAIIGNIAYIIVLIPVVISSLRALELRGISEPAIDMLQTIFTMLPNIFVAVLLVLIGVWLGGWLNQLVAGLLERIGFDSLASHLGIKPQASATITMSQLVGRITQIVVIILFITEALQVVKLEFLVQIFEAVISYLPNLFVSVIILGIGLYLGNLVQKLLRNIVKSGWQFLHLFAKYAIITVSVFMALDQLGVASSIVSSAFIILLGGLALAFGLAFGLGGREFAANWLKRWQAPNSESTSGDKQSDD